MLEAIFLETSQVFTIVISLAFNSDKVLEASAGLKQ